MAKRVAIENKLLHLLAARMSRAAAMPRVRHKQNVCITVTTTKCAIKLELDRHVQRSDPRYF